MQLIKKLKKRPFCSAVVAAAGSSTRAGRDKLFSLLGGESVLARTLRVLDDSEWIDEIIVVTRPEKIPEAAELCRACGIVKVTKILCGGETRTQSVLCGVSETDRRAELIAVHDGARPLVTEKIIEDAVHAAVLYQAAAPAVPVKDTVKRADKGVVSETLPRDEIFAVQTPQIFCADLIKAALTKAVQDGAAPTDDCMAVEALGVPVHLTQGSEENIKITTPPDFRLAELILESRQET